MGAKILNFNQTNSRIRPKSDDNELSQAFHWALSEQKRQGFLAQPITLNFSDEEEIDCGKAHVSLFYQPYTGEALMVRVWSERGIAQFNRIENYQELLAKAPMTLRRFRDNALALYRVRSLVG